MQEYALINSLDKKEEYTSLSREEDFTYIFEKYYKRVYNYVYYRISNTYTAEDLTSQIFEKIILKLDTYSKNKSPFHVWVFAIARNVMNDYFRSLKKHSLFSLDAIKDLVSREKTPEDIILTSETNSKLSNALKILNSREKNIVALKFGATLKNTEIAKILNIKESNVGVILYRTMKKLKKEMEREE